MSIFRIRQTALVNLVTVITALMAAGCVHRPSTGSPAIDRPARSCVSPVAGLLEYSDMLNRSSQDVRQRAVRQMRRAARAHPTAATYARLSIALGTPRQRLYTPDEAARYARKALAATPNDWDRISRRFLIDQAHHMDRIAGRTTGRGNASPTSSNARARVAELERALAAARAKISALSDIESQIENNGAGR
ncbi:MAG: hypothetical protein CMP08_03555 [Xanthomonadales bacterium]|nr:hypothetical protein [Xanthomonadales bacterium]|tara:strand:- start:2458 stop:3033 length:576 start_codon:yes stop_codon:yes gene_type:complete